MKGHRVALVGLALLAGVAAGWLAARRTSVRSGATSPASSPTSTAADQNVFTEIAAASGIDFVHHSGASGKFLFPEIMGGGCGLLDYDGDGYLDAYLVQSGVLYGPRDGAYRNRLYRNDGQGRFHDVTDAAGVGGRGYGMGCAAGDYDNDGDIDLYVTNVGPNVLYRNNGDGTFSDVTAAAGVGDPSWSTSAAFVDYDADGDLDLFVCNYLDWSEKPAFTEKQCFAATGARDYCSPQAYAAPAYSTLYRNNGDGTFTDVSLAAGIRGKAGTALGVVCTDLDGDDRVDIYVANDQMPSFAWLNRGDGTFVESAVTLGCAVDELGKSQAGMGVDAQDIDDDGDFDLWKVHLHREPHILYLNRGGYFDDVTSAWGLAAATRRFTGFGTAMFDYDLDGLRDILVANGRVQFVADVTPSADIYAEPNQMLRQSRPGHFEDISSQCGRALALVENSRAAAFGDIDNDGDIDILVANRDGRARLLRNDARRLGAFITFRVLDRHGRDAYGAKLIVKAGSATRTAEVRAAFSYCATSDPRVHFGLGNATQVDSATIRWPDGTSQSAGPFEAGKIVEWRQGSGRP